MSEAALPHLDWRVVFNRKAPNGIRGWGRVRSAQLKEMSRAMVVAAWGQTFNALLIVAMLADQVPASTMALWLTALGLLMAFSLYHKRLLNRRDVRLLPRRTLDRAAYHSIFFGAVWAFPARYFFDHATHHQQLALGIVTATMMAGAAFIFAPVPAAAAAYIAMMGVAVTHMLSTSNSLLITAIGPVYTAAMLMIVLIMGRAFMARTCLDLALEERRETVSLLLREYESSDADWLWQTNGRLCFHNVSQRFARTIGRGAEELEGMSILDLLDNAPRGDQAARRTLAEARALLTGQEAFSELVVPIRVGDTIKCIELAARPRYSAHGRFMGYQGVGSDVTESRRAADRIAHMARHDALTGLPNRLQLLDNLELALASARKRREDCAVLLIDLDRFKAINDTLGHIAGDHLLKQVAGAFEMVIADEMTAGRLGGDEFAIIVPRAESRESLEQLALALIGALHGPFYYRDQRLVVGASVGVAIAPEDGANVEELMRNADLALYNAKAGAGDEVRFYEPGLHAKAEERRRIELALRGAIDAGELSLVYQPVVAAGTGEIEGFEALLRWTHDELGSVPPDKFIPIAEETGLLGRMGEWVLRTACREAATWPAGLSLAVNVSPKQLREPGFIVTLMSALTQAGLSPERLELEVTETVFLEVSGQTQRALHQIQSLGVRLAMDDFGTGYSSLGYLRRAEFDTLKIDRSFVQAISDDDPESTAIIRAVVALAGSLGMRTVAEGVATNEQLDTVRELGCDCIQGYVFSRPVSPERVQAMIRKGARLAA